MNDMIVEDTPIEALPSFRTIWHPHDQNKIEIKGQSADEIAEELVKVWMLTLLVFYFYLESDFIYTTSCKS